MREAVQFTGLALVAAVLMTGCGGSGGSGSDKDERAASASGSPSAATSQRATGGTGGAGALDGTYAARSDDGPVGLSVHRGKAGLYSNQGKRACTGVVHEDRKPAAFELRCADGNTDRATGTISRPNNDTLVVSWGSGKKDTFTRKADAAPLPDPTRLGGGLPAPTKLGG
ncbi:hypothetical protein [Streptomyces sp. NPDC053048]|uniref:hypothetical protein n=1 Tax=Streptomyces sp. NPDC053048 TaxID=3365694 RepID=UPI0037D05786